MQISRFCFVYTVPYILICRVVSRPVGYSGKEGMPVQTDARLFVSIAGWEVPSSEMCGSIDWFILPSCWVPMISIYLIQKTN